MALHDELVIAAREDLPNLAHDYAFSGFHGTVLRNIHEVLVARDPVTNAFTPELATEWEQVDELTWRFQLREGVQFHDGSEFNAEAAAYALSWTWDEENAPVFFAQMPGPAITFEAVGEYTLLATTEEPDPTLLVRLWASTLTSAEQLQRDPEERLANPVGTGPYKLASWEPGREIVLEANLDWWGIGAPDAQGSLNFERVVFLIRTDADSRIAAFRAGEAHVGERLAAGSCVADLGDQCVFAPQSDVVQIWPEVSTGNPVLSDIRIRQAINLAIDRSGIGEFLLPGAEPASQPVSEAVRGFNRDLAVAPYDQPTALELVEAAKADGVPVDETVLQLILRDDSFIGNLEVLEFVDQALREIGLNIEVRVLDRQSWIDERLGVLRPNIPSERGGLWLHKHTNNSFDSAISIAAFFSSGCGDGTSGIYCNEAVDAALAAARPLVGDERDQALGEIWRMLSDDVAYVAIVNQTMTHGVAPDVIWTPRADTTVLAKDIDLAR